MPVREQNKKNRILLGEDNNALTWLIIINSVIFLGLLFIKLVYQIGSDNGLQHFQTEIADWMALPASGYRFLTRPWTILTYMFTHDNLWYLISSMLWLWCFGYILQDLTGNNKLIPIYTYGGVIGGIVFLISANVIPYLHADLPLLSETGAAAPVVAIAIATTVLAPDYRIFQMLNGGIPIWIITVIFVTIDFGTVGASNSAIAISHIASGLTGFLFVKQLKKGNDPGAWMSGFANWINDLFNPEKKIKTNQLYYKPTRKPYEKTLQVTQQRVDELLEKIHQNGYHFLSDEEKEFLKKASQEDML